MIRLVILYTEPDDRPSWDEHYLGTHTARLLANCRACTHSRQPA